MQKIRTMNIFLIISLMLMLTACNVSAPLPKQPKRSKRIPVNKTLPIEIEEQAINGKL